MHLAMVEYIIHADDFGKDDGVNHAIDLVISRGLCDETSLIVNMPCSDAAVQLARTGDYADRVGIHVNLTEGFPLTQKIRSCPRFCGNDGSFNRVFHLSSRTRFFLNRTEQTAVSEELAAQLDRFVAYGGLRMRIDSHHHVHTDWSIYQLLKPLAIERGFKEMRLSADMHHVRFDKAVYKMFFNHDVRRHFMTTDHFAGGRFTYKSEMAGRIEVMVHPLMADGILCDSATPYEESVSWCRKEKK